MALPQLLARALRQRWVLALWCAVVTLLCAHGFYRSMWHQTGGTWSAPLDDVFIHLDFARQTARGALFEWSRGNGYSSGATSPLYALLLAAAYSLGAHGTALLVVAAMLAMLACWVALLGYARGYLAMAGPSPTLLTLPLVFYAVGAADWAYWSGMEVALFVGLHGAAFGVWCTYVARRRAPHAWAFGVLCMFLVATRPEALVTVGLFALGLGFVLRRGRVVVLSLAPSVAYVVGLGALNRLLTGEATAYGALVKLAWYNPTFDLADKWLDYRENLQHVVKAVFMTHVGSVTHASSVLLALAVLPLGDRKLRPAALVLWAQWLSWFLLIGLNGQVRWQNERYAMPAVAMLLVLAAFGVACARRVRWTWLVAGAVGLGTFFVSALPDVYERRPRWPYPFDVEDPPGEAQLALLGRAPVVWFWALGFLVLAGCAVRFRRARPLAIFTGALVLADVTEPNVRTQRWFYGRAAKNILEQQTTLGTWLRDEPIQGRVLVGDAGAILYASDWKGLDLIGLGGFHRLPFARAGALGLGAQLELLERVPQAEWPQLIAIFPSWWETLPLFFSSEVIRRFPIVGNVICGDFEHVVYRADWRLLRTGSRPRTIPAQLQVVDDLDVGDLVSERDHAYAYGPTHRNGKVTFEILRDVLTDTDVLDAGRRLAPGSFERFALRRAVADRPAYVFVRTAPEGNQQFRVTVRGAGMADRVTPVSLLETGGFIETPIRIEPPMAAELQVEIDAAAGADLVDYHVYLAQ